MSASSQIQPFLGLPIPIEIQIVTHLDIPELVRLSSVCKRAAKIALGNYIWNSIAKKINAELPDDESTSAYKRFKLFFLSLIRTSHVAPTVHKIPTCAEIVDLMHHLDQKPKIPQMKAMSKAQDQDRWFNA